MILAAAVVAFACWTIALGVGDVVALLDERRTDRLAR
jgi:hypothetical protein